MKFLLVSLSLIVFLACSNKAGKHTVHFDTLPNGQRLLDNLDSGMMLYYKEVVGSDTLQDGSIVCYGIDDSMRYLYLRKGENLHLLNKESVHVSPWSLGTLQDTIGSFIVTRIDNGNSSPSSYQAFDIRTGKNILGEDELATDYLIMNDSLFILHGNSTLQKDSHKLFLLNATSGKQETYLLPAGIYNSLPFYIDSLSTKKLHISFYEPFNDIVDGAFVFSRK